MNGYLFLWENLFCWTRIWQCLSISTTLWYMNMHTVLFWMNNAVFLVLSSWGKLKNHVGQTGKPPLDATVSMKFTFISPTIQFQQLKRRPDSCYKGPQEYETSCLLVYQRSKTHPSIQTLMWYENFKNIFLKTKNLKKCLFYFPQKWDTSKPWKLIKQNWHKIATQTWANKAKTSFLEAFIS